nr:unnamed protein product [Meloidogyne enterolobii]CAD2182637.1 unnamed protein product [Meloidogyne enterolobii]
MLPLIIMGVCFLIGCFAICCMPFCIDSCLDVEFQNKIFWTYQHFSNFMQKF